jgi:large subunit ribosomal protein L17
MRNLVKALIQRGRIFTTQAKAKEMRRWAERMITLGKSGGLHARRQAFAFLGNRQFVKVLFDEVAPRFQGRVGGYTRVLKVGLRKGDGAPISLVELTAQGRAGGREKRVEVE